MGALLGTVALLTCLIGLCVLISFARYEKPLEPVTYGQAQAQKGLPAEARPKLSLFVCPNSTLVRLRAAAHVAVRAQLPPPASLMQICTFLACTLLHMGCTNAMRRAASQHCSLPRPCDVLLRYVGRIRCMLVFPTIITRIGVAQMQPIAISSMPHWYSPAVHSLRTMCRC